MVRVYSKDDCRNCVAVKNFLRNNGVNFEEINIDYNAEAKEEIVNAGYIGVPITRVDGKDIVGFDLPKLKELI